MDCTTCFNVLRTHSDVARFPLLFDQPNTVLSRGPMNSAFKPLPKTSAPAMGTLLSQPVYLAKTIPVATLESTPSTPDEYRVANRNR
ncbi:hypothetical protein Gasu2_18790 [Galdieria sulphuraria]|nr:hypothetical protein Gasu2_18790 [Galdieria sulphuraria]